MGQLPSVIALRPCTYFFLYFCIKSSTIKFYDVWVRYAHLIWASNGVTKMIHFCAKLWFSCHLSTCYWMALLYTEGRSNISEFENAYPATAYWLHTAGHKCYHIWDRCENEPYAKNVYFIFIETVVLALFKIPDSQAHPCLFIVNPHAIPSLASYILYQKYLPSAVIL